MKLFLSLLIFLVIFVVGLVTVALIDTHYGVTDFWRGGYTMLVICIAVDTSVYAYKECWK